jgi:hypothetical protein
MLHIKVVTVVCYLMYLLLPLDLQHIGGIMHKTEVVEHFGGISKTANALGISHPAVCRWGEIIPEKQAFVIERITKGKLKYDSKLYQKPNETAA